MNMPKIVIVGGGAGGLELACRLGKRLGRHKLAEVHLIDKNLTTIWKPLWHEVAAGTLILTESEVAYLGPGYKNNFTFHLGSLEELDCSQQTVVISQVNNPLTKQQILPLRSLSYDYLVIAIGSKHNNFNIAGVDENCYFFDSFRECQAFQQEIINKFIQIQENLAETTNLVIVGGGATGVELAAELYYAFKQNLIYARSKLKLAELFNISLIESAPQILSGMPQQLAQQITKQLTSMGIKIYLNENVSQVDKAGVTTHSGLMLPAAITVWAAGIKAPESIVKYALKIDKSNRIEVKSTLQSQSDEHVFAIGDCARCPTSSGDHTLVPATAQAARQQALLLADSLCYNILDHQPLRSFSYRDSGSIIAVKHTNAAGYLSGNKFFRNISLRGKLAVFVYRYLYRRYQANLYGWWPTLLLIVSELLVRPVRLRLKLH